MIVRLMRGTRELRAWMPASFKLSVGSTFSVQQAASYYAAIVNNPLLTIVILSTQYSYGMPL